MPVDRSNVTDAREDISRFVVHLTSEGEGKREGSARENLFSILKSQKIEARGLHCLHKQKLAELPYESQKQFKVGCFTEIPLHQIHLLIQPVAGRTVIFKPYGIVFNKRFLIEKGAQPAIYINSYGQKTFHREAATALFRWCARNNFQSPAARLLPLLNAMHEEYDFTWEREWRVVGDLRFKSADIVCLILPMSGEDKLKAACAKHGVPAISPGWTYEQIVSEMASQQRKTRTTLRNELKKLEAEIKAAADAAKDEAEEAEAMQAQVDSMDPR